MSSLPSLDFRRSIKQRSMQHGLASAANGDCLGSSIASHPFGSPDRRPVSPSYLNIGGDLFYPYAGLSPMDAGLSPMDEASPQSTPRLSLCPITVQDAKAIRYQTMAESYDICLFQLRDLADKLESLRLENANLRAANGELARLLALSFGKNTDRIPSSVNEVLAEELRRLSVAELPSLDESSPMVLALQNNGEGESQRRCERQPMVLPKSISIRSSGYLKLNPSGGACPTNRNSRFRATYPPAKGGSQQVYVSGGSSSKKAERGKTVGEGPGDGDEALEVDVYHQGMFKTELCNKWEETGTCPYGEHCQFAHGIAELRPILRHPRYKTELCRMILFGDACPYGHRCHFRHTLSSEHEHLHLRP